ncbi:hypothetical protein A2U01_0070577 [Trifolium medium]|uniref:Uncharacterized protein n=1 Tax=Trifolium medium TaxID=97028 RepID=A0A392SKE5_9FABA|nr:hypothetical protein [Trifolium medium]
MHVTYAPRATSPAQRAAGRGYQRQQTHTRAAPALAALRANTNDASRISDFLLPRFQGTFNTYNIGM